MTVAYFAHRYWSFSHRARTSVRREYVLFTVINGAALLLGMAVVAIVRYPLGQDSALVLQTANIASIVLSTVLRYLAYRTWVFPAHEPDAGGDPLSADEAAQARIVA
jgi:putative flippase GtrA